MLGARETPSIAQGRVLLLMQLLSPARRPIQLTRDLPGFWAGSYAQVRKEMCGRYPQAPLARGLRQRGAPGEKHQIKRLDDRQKRRV